MRWTDSQLMEYLDRKGNTTVKEKPKSKYRNKHTWIDGICFHSRKEADRYSELKLLLKAGEIKGFCRQPEFVLVEGNETDRAVTYKADFIVLNNDDTYQIEDVKGYEPQEWERTYKLFRLKYPKLELILIK